MRGTLLRILGCVLIGYFIGCLSPAFLIGHMKGYDVRKSGSKNAGASNTFLMAGKSAGVFVALADIAKATFAWWICLLLFPRLRLAGVTGGTACVIGHMYPVFLRFHGGKGLACIGGMAVAAGPKTFFVMLTAALIIAIISNYISVVTCGMSLVFPTYFGYSTGMWIATLIMLIPAVPIFIKHMENFRRIAAGQELRLSYLWNREKELERTGYNEQL